MSRFRPLRTTAIAGALALLVTLAHARAPAQPPAPAKPLASAMDAKLFFEVLVGELTVGQGDAGTAYALLLDAANRTRDPVLYERAMAIALTARDGPAALNAVRAWRQVEPASREASQAELQILLALGRVQDTPEAIAATIRNSPTASQRDVILALPLLVARASDKQAAQQAVETAMRPWQAQSATAAAVRATRGRMRLLGGDRTGALAEARESLRANPRDNAAPMLALELLDAGHAPAEALVQQYLTGLQRIRLNANEARARNDVRMGYIQVLSNDSRLEAARAQAAQATIEQPTLADNWLLLGTLQAQLNQARAAQTSLQRYLALLEKAGDARHRQPGTAPAATDPNSGDEDDTPTPSAEARARQRGMSSAYLSLAQLAEKRGDHAGAERWLSRIADTDEALSVQLRRASLLARRGKLDEARTLIRAVPARDAASARHKQQAEAQLLSENGQSGEAYALLQKAMQAAPSDVDLTYSTALMAEKAGDVDGMERLLRQIIDERPDYAHAYNALGYSLANRNLRLPEARLLLEKAVELAPANPLVRDSLGWVEFRLGNLSKARRLLEDAFKARPDPEIGAHLGEVMWVQGERERAQQIWRQALALDANNDTLRETLQRIGVRP